MALFTRAAPVDYEAQSGRLAASRWSAFDTDGPAEAFEQFLSSFKSLAAASETSAVRALQDLNLDGLPSFPGLFDFEAWE